MNALREEHWRVTMAIKRENSMVNVFCFAKFYTTMDEPLEEF
jgi:hypothetical protein